jgi:hypothetical protein
MAVLRFLHRYSSLILTPIMNDKKIQEIDMMQRTDLDDFIFEASKIHIPNAWKTPQLKNPRLIFTDNNRRYAFITAMCSMITQYNATLEQMYRSIELNEDTLCQLDALMELANQVTAIQKAYTYQPAGSWLNRIKRAAYGWFYPKTAVTVKESLMLSNFISVHIEHKQQTIEAMIYEQQEHAVLNALSCRPIHTQASMYMRYNHVLSKHGQVDNYHKPQWVNSTYRAICDEANSIVRWLGKNSLIQKSEKWINAECEEYGEDKQQLFTVAKHLSASVALHSHALVTSTTTILSDWGHWAKQKITQLDTLSVKASDLCSIFLPTQATMDAYSEMKQSIEKAKGSQQQQIQSRLDSAERLALQCIEKNKALFKQLNY